MLSKRPLNSRQKYFARIIIKEGYYTALKCAGYSKKYGYKLLNDPRIERYQMNLINESVEIIGMTLSDLLQKKLDLADDVKTPPTLRNTIYTELIDMIRSVSEGTPRGTFKFTGTHKMLRPSREKFEGDGDKN